MPKPKPRGYERDPFAVFNFIVEIDEMEVAGFTEVSGLQVETETEDYREGGVNDFIHKLSKGSKYSTLTLKRGISDAQNLWNWHQKVVQGVIERKSITVILNDAANKEKWRWMFTGAYPVKWTGTDLNATNNTIVVESLEFVHTGMKKM